MPSRATTPTSWMLGFAALVLALPTAASAHPLAPAVLEIREAAGGRVEVGWKTPLIRPRGADLEPVPPARCRSAGPRTVSEEGGGVWTRWAVECGAGGLVGERVGVAGPGSLSLAALGLVDVPARLIEVAIATSVLALAVELAREPAAPTLMRRHPWAMAVAFGLLHGLGFAAALRDAGLPAGEIPLALLSFNVGIEVGQVLFVLAVLGLGRVAARLPARTPAWAGRASVYGMGSLAGYWWLERALALLR